MKKLDIWYILLLCVLLTSCGGNKELVNSTSSLSDELTEQQETINQELAKNQDIQSVVNDQSSEIKNLESVIDEQNKMIQERDLCISELEEQLNEIYLDNTENIQSALYKSPNQKYATIIIILDLSYRFTYFSNLETEESYVLDSKIPSQTFWSPDSNYFVLDEGTGQSRWGNIYSVESLKLIDKLRYRGLIYWLNSEEVIFVEDNSDIKIDTGIELDYTTNIAKYNVVTTEKEILLEGTVDYYFYIDKVNKDKTIKISKNYINKESTDNGVDYISLTTD